jgi:hypothetical protein
MNCCTFCDSPQAKFQCPPPCTNTFFCNKKCQEAYWPIHQLESCNSIIETQLPQIIEYKRRRAKLRGFYALRPTLSIIIQEHVARLFEYSLNPTMEYKNRIAKNIVKWASKMTIPPAWETALLEHVNAEIEYLDNGKSSSWKLHKNQSKLTVLFSNDEHAVRMKKELNTAWYDHNNCMMKWMTEVRQNGGEKFYEVNKCLKQAVELGQIFQKAFQKK